MNSVNSLTVANNAWTLINVFLLYAASPLKSLITVYIWTKLHGYFYDAISTSISISADDTVTVGPFIGDSLSIYNMKIFSPGAIAPVIGCNINL